MSLPPDAQAVLTTAEQGLRTLVEEAAREGRYADVIQLAEAANVVRRLIGSADPPFHSARHEQAEAHLTPARAVSQGRSPKKPAEYPKFEIDGDRLVKIGWSKRERAEYQHKAPRDVALCTYLQLSKDRPTDLFRMEEHFPIQMEDGAEVPTYQSYMVLAWLRYIGYIEKVGKDSYRWIHTDIDEASFKHAWDSTRRSSS